MANAVEASSVAAVQAAPRRQLSLFDSTAIIVGIIIGSGVYGLTPLIASGVSSAAALFGLWACGGAFALIGALCYAELATAYPSEGGDYVYLSRAFGKPVGLLFGWSQLWVIRPGSLGAMAFVFASYARELYSLGSASLPIYAASAIVTLAVVNILGVRAGKWTQNILTAAKVVGLLLVCGVGWFAAPAATAEVTPLPATGMMSLSLLFVLFTYSGWNEMPNVAAEVVEPQRNILRALVLGTLAVTVIYLLLATAFVRSLGLTGVQQSQAVATDVVSLALGAWGGKAVSLLICISTLGAMNGMTLCGSRVYYALGREHAALHWLGRWHPRLGTPVVSLVTEATITLATVLVLTGIYGTDSDCFQRLVIFTTPVFWLFLLLSVAGLMVLRVREPQVPRPFRVPLYPVLPLVLCAVCGWMAYCGVDYALKNGSWEAIWTVVVLGSGVVLAFAGRTQTPAGE